MKKIYILTLILLFAAVSFSQQVIHKGDVYYLSNTLIIKFKSGVGVEQKSIQDLFKKSNLSVEFKNFQKLYPTTVNQLSKGEGDLDRIYFVEYNSTEDPNELAKKISKQNSIEYAEPRYIHRLTYTPNDSLYNFLNQADLFRVAADSAWNITKGNPSVIIGIVDTGVDWNHPDLKANILRDSSGNLIGKDFGGINGTPDDDPSEDKTPATYIRQAYHGTHVAGIASAVSDNKIGISSIGYSCSILPVKASRGDVRDDNGYPLVYYGFDAIKWASEHGAKIINCSWGSSAFSYSEQDVINYVTSKGTLVVAAQGNDGKEGLFYPADYKNVLSVGWCDNNDVKNFSANYGKELDVMAPGSVILSTWPGVASGKPNDYASISGSSMSSPHVAGLAGLVAARFPNYSPQQIAEQIRVTADDNIYKVNNSADLKYLLGKGRINAYRAVSQTNAVSVRITDVKYIETGNGNGLFETGEEGTAQLTLTNYLNSVNGLQVSVECNDASVQLSTLFIELISMSTGQTLEAPPAFKFKILNGSPYDHDVNFLVKFSAGTYSDFQWLTIRINPTYDTHNSSKIVMSITSKGTFGFNDYPANLNGQGFRYNGGDNLLFEGAFMYGTDSTKVMDGARETSEQSKDFVMLTPIKLNIDKNGNQIGVTSYNDSGAGKSALGIETKQTSYSFVNPPDDKYVILVNELQNKTAGDINNLYAGYFFDWDMPADDSGKDSTAFDPVEKFGYAFYQDQKKLSTIVGAALISSTDYSYYPINNAAASGDVKLFDANGFTDAEKWISLSSGIVKKNDGFVDVSFVVGRGPFNIAANKSVKIAYVIAAADNLSDLRTVIHQSRLKYEKDIISDVSKEKTIPASFALYQNYPNPFNPETVISFQLPEAGQVSLKVYDILGREIATLVNEFKQAGTYNSKFSTQQSQLPSGVYFYTLHAGNFVETKKMLLVK